MLFTPKYELVTEAYVGKTNNLKQAEQHLAKILEIIYEFDQPSFKTSKIINYSSPCKKFCELLSKEFGTKILVNFSPRDYHGAGAYTFVSSTMWSFASVSEEYEKNGRIKSAQRLYPIYVTVSYNIINKEKLQADELMAIILHEIGHNITHVPIINSLNIIALLLRPVTSTIFSNLDRFVTMVEGLPVINQAVRFLNLFEKTINDITGERLNAFMMFYRLVLTGGYRLVALIDPVRHFGGYLGERYSDSLATAYGYGDALSRGLMKISVPTTHSTYNKVVNSNKVTAFGDVFLLTFADICMMITLRSVHPKIGHRIKNSLNKLERDLANGDYPPEVKRELEADVKMLRKTYEDYLNASDQQKNEVVSFYRKYIERYTINPLRNIALDDAYASLEV